MRDKPSAFAGIAIAKSLLAPSGQAKNDKGRVPLKAGVWRNQRCHIVGGGPSLKGFDWSSLDGELTIAINRAFQFFTPSIMIASDRRFYRWLATGEYGDNALNALRDLPCRKLWVTPEPSKYPNWIDTLQPNARMACTRQFSEGLALHGNTGIAAINLAVLLGSREIYLHGFDDLGQTWFHDGHPSKETGRPMQNVFAAFERLADDLRSRGVQVVNTNSHSKLTCFCAGGTPAKGQVFFDGYYGMGDQLHQRIQIKDLASRFETIYLRTPYPQFYWDLPNVKFLPAHSNLRTQEKNIASLPDVAWSKKPDGIAEVPWRAQFASDASNPAVNLPEYYQSIIEQPYDFEMPLRPEWLESADVLIESLGATNKPICVVKWPTVRSEWRCDTRNPKAEYFSEALAQIPSHWHVISVADIKQGEEDFVGELSSRIDTALHSGELGVETFLALTKRADLVVCYPSCLMLFAIAVRARTICIWGGHLSPQRHISPIMNLERFEAVVPDPPCNCGAAEHDCNKDLPDGALQSAMERAIASQHIPNCKIGIPAGIGDMHWILLKLQSFREQYGIEYLTLNVHEDQGHKNSIDFLKMVPFVDATEDTGYGPWVWKIPAAQRNTDIRRNLHGCDFLIEFNSHLEQGKRIEEVLPEFAIDWNYPVEIPEDALAFAKELREKLGGRLVLTYASSRGGNINWARGAWSSEDWRVLMHRIMDKTGSPTAFLGQTWDADYGTEICKNNDAVYDLVGQTDIFRCMALIKEADLIIGFPSGLTIMATHFRTPCVMFWPVAEFGKFDPGFHTAWVNPEVIESGIYIPMQFGAPDTTVEGVMKAITKWL